VGSIRSDLGAFVIASAIMLAPVIWRCRQLLARRARETLPHPRTIGRSLIFRQHRASPRPRSILRNPLWLPLLLLSLSANITGVFGPFLLTELVVIAHPTDGSSNVLPFIVKNNSTTFAARSVKFLCGVDLIWAEDAKGHRVVVRDAAFASEGLYVISRAAKPINFPCNALHILQTREDGSLSLYGSSTTMSSKALFQPPWRILKMCIWLGANYKIRLFGHRSFVSNIFQWPAAPGSHEWIEGLIAREPPKEEQLPGYYPDALQCHDRLMYPYLLADGPGQMKLIFDQAQTW